MVRLKKLEFMEKKVRRNCLIISPYIILVLGIGLNLSGAQGNGNVGGKKNGPPIPPTTTRADLNQRTLTELEPDPVGALLLVSTLDGSLIALDRLSGQKRWKTDDQPMFRAPSGEHHENEAVKPPYFLPDPRSGSLYVLGGHSQVKKLPFTIPQLVSMAPCRSSEGLLYTGRKSDTWISLNPLTGEKSEIMSFGDSTCPVGSTASTMSAKTMLIGKTEYTISMLDGTRKWNVTFQDYSSVDMTEELKEDYELVHFTSPSAGTILTYERGSGQLLWQSELQSPVMALYSIDSELSNLLSIPFTSVASQTLNRIKTPAKARDNSQLSPTLYIGQCPYGLYAVQSLVDDSVLTISSTAPTFPYLIEGPSPTSEQMQLPEPDTQKTDPLNVDENVNTSIPPSNESDKDFVILGHYDIPESAKAPAKQISSESPSLEHLRHNDSFDKIISPAQSDPPANLAEELSHTFPPTPSNTKPSRPKVAGSSTSSYIFPPPIEKSSVPVNKEKSFAILTTALITIAVTSIIMSVVFLSFREFQWKKPPNKFLSGSDGIISVGKISYDPTSVLGKGCEGTFVFKGKFDGRDIAVKRILPECFEFADREVDLLKESDQHANVIRYFCTESDGQFRYIALELCSATLCDWVGGRFVHNGVKAMDVLKEATDGLAYLHSLRIVHRDVKPANVLLTVCPTSNTVRAMISDFGLCKKLATGRVSFSRRSGGIPGTEGWIAPEMMQNTERTTYAVDIFSLGCVYYYVLTNGGHPFGDALRRQSNIISGELCFEELKNSQGASELIKQMISFNAAERPPIAAIVTHPIFWSKEKILAFFMDVSDRIEKENEATCEVLRRLETNASQVARDDWRDHICAEVAMDLRKYRTYKGNSIRDLLRALRNKKNHYRELTVEAQNSLGQIPDKFVSYWVDRFPALLPHTWEKFESIKREPIFSKYYCDNFDWTVYDDSEMEYSHNADENVQFVQDESWRRRSPEVSDNFNHDPNSPQSQQFRPKLGKNFWRSKNQQRSPRWKNQFNNSVHPEFSQKNKPNVGFRPSPPPVPEVV